MVHGGQAQLNRAMKEKNLQIQSVNGLRVTSKEVLELADDVFNQISLQIKNEIEKHSYNCLILNRETGFIKSRQNPNLGFVGIPEIVELSILNKLSYNIIPVVPSVTAGTKPSDIGFNVNADDVAGFIASKVKAEKLILVTDVEGVFDENKNLLTKLTVKQAQELIDSKMINGGMIPKVKTCIKALKEGVEKCHIVKGCPQPLIKELASGKAVGTTVRQ